MDKFLTQGHFDGAASVVAPARLRVKFETGYSKGKYNDGPYSRRGDAFELKAHIVQNSVCTVTLETGVIDLSSRIVQRSPVFVDVRKNTNKTFNFAIIQTEETSATLEVFPPFVARALIVQHSSFNSGTQYYVGRVYLDAKIVQKSPVKIKASLERDLKCAVTQSTVFQASFIATNVKDLSSHVTQSTVFVPGVQVSWSRWTPFNLDYPAPWNPAREAA